MNLADLLKEILGRTGLQRTNDQGMEKKPTEGDNSGRTLKPDILMEQKKINKDPANVYDDQGNIVDYKPGGRSISDLLSAGKSGDNPFSGLIANGGSGQGTLTGFLSRILSPTPERNAPGQVQGQGTVGGGDPNAGTPGTGIDPGLNPVPSKDQKVPAFAERTPTGTPTPLPLADQPPSPPPADYSMPNALDPQQIEELRGSLLTQSGQLNPGNPNSLAGRMGDPNSKVDMQDQMRQAEDISNAVQPLQKGDNLSQQKPEYNYLGDLVDRITGNTTKINYLPSATNLPYPSEEDATSARKYGLGYGTGNESSRANIVSRVLNGLYSDEIPAATKDSPSQDISKQPEVSSRIDRAQIAVERNPIAKLGFDTSRINIEPNTKPRTLGGVYDPKSDQSYVNFANNSGSTLIHESIHRGLTMLKDNPEAKALMAKLPNQESITRYIMLTQMGDPESGSGSIADKQIAAAKTTFENKYNKQDLDKLIELAANEVKNKRPGGPR